MILSKSKINLIKILDSTAGRLFCFLLPRLDRNNGLPRLIKNILIIRPGGIGDVVLLIPVIRLLKDRWPDAAIDILAEKRNESVFSFISDIHVVYKYDKLKDFCSVMRNKYDVVIDTEQWGRLSAVVTRLTGAPISIGYATNNREKMLTHHVLYSHDDYETVSFLHLLTPLQCKGVLDLKRPSLSIPLQVSKRVQTFLQPLSGKKLVAVFPGGSVKQKRWGSQRFRDTAKLLVQGGYGVVIVGGEADIQEAKEICFEQRGVITVCGKLSLMETAAVIKKSNLLVSGDSGIMHIGSALGTRVLALFGPSNSLKWSPQSNYSFVITKHLKCSPCSKFGQTPRCKYHLECMNQITVSEVVENAVKLMEK